MKSNSLHLLLGSLVFSSTSVRLAQATPVTVDDPAPGGPQVFAMDADDSSR